MSPAVMNRSSEEDIYQEHVMDHYEDPYHRGQCAGCTHAWEDRNPLCGDRLKLQLHIEPNGEITEAWFEGEGCCISQASASMLVEAVEGKTVEEAKHFAAQDMLQLFGAKLTPNRQKCCLLAWRVFQQAVHAPLSSNP
jgi:nitrogen fixation protein NifU and related proteins